MLEGPHRNPGAHYRVALPMDTKIDQFLRDFSGLFNLDGASSALTKLVHRWMFLVRLGDGDGAGPSREEKIVHLMSEMAEKDVWSPKTRRGFSSYIQSLLYKGYDSARSNLMALYCFHLVNVMSSTFKSIQGSSQLRVLGSYPVGGENVFPAPDMPRSGSEARRCRGDRFGGLNKWVRAVRARGAWVQERGSRPGHDQSLSPPNPPPPPLPLPNMPKTSGKQYRRNTPSSRFTQSSLSRRPKA
ncbi:hypothetical protein B0H10DRAFT_1950172 [Mycena sp. CBHHK59/15]|nr:hypothetical protein B0H10DRAFT_1950172 [Mycena sp. CBHHK59/15]